MVDIWHILMYWYTSVITYTKHTVTTENTVVIKLTVYDDVITGNTDITGKFWHTELPVSENKIPPKLRSRLKMFLSTPNV